MFLFICSFDMFLSPGNNGDAVVWSALRHCLRIIIRSTVNYHWSYRTTVDI